MWRKSYLKGVLLTMHLQECGGKEKMRNTCALARWAGPGVAWRGEHNVHVNGPLKSGSKPHRSTTSFCRLFLQ
jgi:hypothetical protein